MDDALWSPEDSEQLQQEYLDEVKRDQERDQELRAIAADQTAEAVALLSVDFDHEPHWFNSKLGDMLGPILAGDFVIVAARPSNGKTTFMLNQTVGFLKQGLAVVYIGTEMKPARLKVLLACSELGYDPALALQGKWQHLPTNARSNLIDKVTEYEESLANKLVCVPNDRPSLADVAEWVGKAADMGAAVVMIDHLHRMNWGDPSRLTELMTEGLRRMKSLAINFNLRILAAAQLKRGNQYDPLADYMVPPPDAIKQSGAAEEEADTVIMLHRALKHDATEGDMQLVRRGQLPVQSVIEDGAMALHISKSRLVGDARDHEVRLYVGKGRLFETPQARDHYLFHLPKGSQSLPRNAATS